MVKSENIFYKIRNESKVSTFSSFTSLMLKGLARPISQEKEKE